MMLLAKIAFLVASVAFFALCAYLGACAVIDANEEAAKDEERWLGI